MATAIEVAQRGLKRLLVQADEAPLAASEYEDFYTGMNDFMSELEASGIVLGYTPVSAAADEVTVPDGAISAIATNVAVEVAPEYGATVSPSLARSASRGMNVLRKIARPRGRMQYPPNLPRGAGNFGETISYQSPTYGYRTYGLITLSGNTKLTSMGGVSGNLVKANGFWTIQDSEGLGVDITGRMTNRRDGEITARIKAELKLKATGSVSASILGIVVNGDRVNLPSAQFITPALSSTPSEHSFQVSLRLQPGDYVELWVGDIFGSEDITVMDAKVELC